MRIAHKDGGLDSLQRCAGQSGTSTTAYSVVKDLAPLRVPDQDKLRVGTFTIEGGDCFHHGCSTLRRAAVI